MKNVIFTATLTVLLSPTLVSAITPPDSVNKYQVMNKAYRMQIPFIENQGQVEDSNVSFYAKTFGGTVLVGKYGTLTYSFPSENKGGVLIKEVLTDKKVEVKGIEPSPTRINYFKGKDQSKWKTNIPSYNSVSLGEVYKGVELNLKAYGKNVEKLFKVLPRENPEAIMIKLEGAKELKVNEEGELEVITERGPIKFTKPIAYQDIDGKRVEVEVAYQLQETGVRSQETKDEKKETGVRSQKSKTRSQETGDRSQKSELGNPHSAFRNLQSEDLQPETRNPKRFSSTLNPEPSPLNYGFKVGDYDKAFPLIIDPLIASTFIGGVDHEDANSIGIDSNGNVFITGFTEFSDYPTNIYDTSYNGGSSDAFVSKFDSDLTTLLASTFIGGNDQDPSYDLAIDSNDNVYITGNTWSSDYPITDGAYDTVFYGSDIFISKFSNDLSTLSASTFLGDGTGYSITIDPNGTVCVTGRTAGFSFPTTPLAYDTSYNGGYDGFVSKLSSDLTTLLASTFIGSSVHESGSSIVLDESRNIYIGGRTSSTDYPTTPGAYNESYNGGDYDGFVSKFTNDLTSLSASTFIGGSLDRDEIGSIAVDSYGNVYVGGDTVAPDYPTTPGSFDESYNDTGGWPNRDVFISKLDSNLSTLFASTFLGGSGQEVIMHLALDGCNNVYITGNTNSFDYPTTLGAYNNYFDGYTDIIISKLDSSLSYLFQSTFLNPGNSDANSLALDGSGNVYVTGWANSSDYPTTSGAYDETHNGMYDVFVSKLDSDLSAEESAFHSATSSFLSDPYSVSLKFDVDQDEIFDLPCTELLVCEGQVVHIDVWLDNWDSTSCGDVESVSYDLTATDFIWDDEVLQVENITCDPQWDGTCTVTHTPGTATYHMEVAKATGGFPDSEIKLHTIQLKCIDIVEPVVVPFSIENASAVSATPPSTIEESQVTTNAICGANPFTCDADDHCERLSDDNKCPDTAVAEKENYYYREPQGSICEGGNVDVFHVRKGDYTVTEAATATMCDSDCFTKCYDNCGYNEVHVCFLQCVKGCICDHCADWDLEEVCFEYQKRVDCNVECYSQCAQNYDSQTQTAEYNKRCGYDLSEVITISKDTDGDCTTTGTDLESFTIEGIGAAAMGRPMPLDSGTYEICAGTQLIGQPVEVTDCGGYTCRILLPQNVFTVDRGVNSSLANIEVVSDLAGDYLLSLHRRDYNQNPLSVPSSLALPAPAKVSVTTGSGPFSGAFDLSAIDPQPVQTNNYWSNLIIKAEKETGATLECEAAFAYEITCGDSDSDGDGKLDCNDNCPNHPNSSLLGTCIHGTISEICTSNEECDITGGDGFCSMNQEDNYPPEGNGIGDACDCEADFNCDGNVDGGDVGDFITHFGRSTYFNPCSNQDQCLGDFNCDVNVDGGDVGIFIEDFGRSQYFNPCPACIAGDWCNY